MEFLSSEDLLVVFIVVFEDDRALNGEPTGIVFVELLEDETLDARVICLLLPLDVRDVVQIVPQVVVLLDVRVESDVRLTFEELSAGCRLGEGVHCLNPLTWNVRR